MKRIGRRASILIVVVLFFISCSAFFLYEYAEGVSSWVTSRANRLVYDKDGSLIVPATVLSADGVELFVSNNSGVRYAKDDLTLRKATLHAVGDRSESINTGAILSYKSNLIGYDPLNGLFRSDNERTTINLTINAELSKAAWNAMGKHNGTVGVYNYKTGEILCMVSKPSFDPMKVPDLSGEEYEGVFINRLTGGVYVPGSIFKVVTSMAAIEKIPDIYFQKFTCNGSVSFGVDKINCSGVHGTIDFKTALAKSCNCAFAKISEQLGNETLSEYAAKAGVGQHFFVDGVRTSKGKFDLENAATVERAWAGIGQFTTLVNPMQFMIFMGAIANGGEYVSPYYVNNISSMDKISEYIGYDRTKTVPMLSESTARALGELMRNNTKVTYGDSKFPKSMNICAKTGTAETSDGKPHAWFVGFSNNDDTPLAFVVILEHAGSAQSTALTATASVLKKAAEIFK